MVQRARALVIVVGALGVAACASTKFSSSWKAPDAGPVDFGGQKVAAIVVSPHQSSRYGAEDALTRELTARGVQGVPAYTLIPDDELQDEDKAKARLGQAGIAGAVVMRAVGQQQEISSTPGNYWSGAYYGSFWGYYGWGWGAAFDPGYLRTDNIVTVETLIYDVKNDKLIWAGMSKSTNPSRVDALIRELVAGAAKEMRKQGLVRR